MDSIWRGRVIVTGGALLAVVLGYSLAQGSWGLPAVASLVFCGAMLSRWSNVQLDAWVTGLLLLGYLIGNRGFAQLTLPNIPLLPGEAVLSLAAMFCLWRSAFLRQLPFRRDAINALVVLWIVVGLVRFSQDWRIYHFAAVRDFALVYYALFFFFSQAWAKTIAERRWLIGCLTAGTALCAPFFGLFTWQTDWVIKTLAVGGIPLVYVKSDVAAGFMVSSLLGSAWKFAHTRRAGWLVVAGAALIGIAYGNSRAAMVAFGAVCVWLFVLCEWRTLRVLLAGLAAGALLLTAKAAFDGRPWTSSQIYRLYESVASTTDMQGARRYVAELSDKPDNNQFRLVWWRAVIDETTQENPWLGLGFGRDLAEQFLRTYYGDTNDEFNTRSPHNFLVTIFGRMGLAGLLPLLGLLGAIAWRTWQVGRAAVRDTTGQIDPIMWLTVWAIFVSACFGVVLEGPMGAVVFWTTLGLANALADAKTAPEATPALESSDPLLHASKPGDELASAS